MNLLQQFRATLHELPTFYANRIGRWAIRSHVPINWDNREPGEDLGSCTWCRKPWPCRPWSAAMDGLTKRLHE